MPFYAGEPLGNKIVNKIENKTMNAVAKGELDVMLCLAIDISWTKENSKRFSKNRNQRTYWLVLLRY